MTKTFSTKLDAKVLRMLENFCVTHHMKKSHVLAEIIVEGLERRAHAMAFAESIQKGLEQEREGEFYTSEEVEREIFGKKKAS